MSGDANTLKNFAGFPTLGVDGRLCVQGFEALGCHAIQETRLSVLRCFTSILFWLLMIVSSVDTKGLVTNWPLLGKSACL